MQGDAAMYLSLVGVFFGASMAFFVYAVVVVCKHRRRTKTEIQRRLAPPAPPARMWHASEFVYRVAAPGEELLPPTVEVGPGGACIICFDAPRNAVLFECGHGGVCVACALAVMWGSKKCPLCRDEFSAVLRIAREDPSSGVADVEPAGELPTQLVV